MKFFDKMILALFSIIMLLLSITICFYALDWIDGNIITDCLQVIKEHSAITIGVSLVFVLLAIKGIFFKASTTVTREKNSDGILLKNDNGKLVISRETIENIVNGVAKGFEGTQSVSTKLSVINNSISVLVNLQVVGGVSISELSINLQNKIKEAVKRVTNLELSEVNIRVKSISDVQSKPAVQSEPVATIAKEEKTGEE